MDKITHQVRAEHWTKIMNECIKLILCKQDQFVYFIEQLFFLAFSLCLCYHMEKHYISGMSDSNAAIAVSVFLLHSGKSQCF